MPTTEPFTFNYARNTESAPNFGEQFDQHIEPHGRYVIEHYPAAHLDSRWETGQLTFHHPKHMDFGGDYGEPSNWKRRLSAEYGGKCGRVLSHALIKDGHDGVVTHDENGTREIVDLTGLRRQAVASEPFAVLQPNQFHHLKPEVDAGGTTWAKARTVLRKRSPEYYDLLHAHIQEHGVQVPVLIDNDNRTVMEGNHRVAIADELGLPIQVGNYDNEDHYNAVAGRPSGKEWYQRRQDFGARRFAAHERALSEVEGDWESQRQYLGESHSFPRLKESSFPDIHAAQDYADHVAHVEGLSTLPVIHYPHEGFSGLGRDRRGNRVLALSSDHMRPSSILHEMAHHKISPDDDKDTGHGSKFHLTLLRMMKAHHPDPEAMHVYQDGHDRAWWYMKKNPDQFPPNIAQTDRPNKAMSSTEKQAAESDHRRKGYASALMDELQRRHPKSSIEHGDRTDAGKAWWTQYGQQADRRGRTAVKTAGYADYVRSTWNRAAERLPDQADELRQKGLAAYNKTRAQPSYQPGEMWSESFHKPVGWVRTEKLMPYRQHTGDQHGHSRDTIDAIKDDLVSGHGFTEPIDFTLDDIHGYGTIVEGNHRLTAAHEAGYPYVPVSVRPMRHYLSRNRPNLGSMQRVPFGPPDFPHRPGDEGEYYHPADVLPAAWLHPKSQHPQQKQAAEDYRMQHKAPDEESGSPLHDLTVNGTYPADFYTHPHYYNDGDDSYWHSVSVVQRAQGNPDKKVRVYRSLPAEHVHHGFSTGDWVTTSLEHARNHGRHHSNSQHDWPIIRTTVPAKHLYTNGDSLNEWGYIGPAKSHNMIAFKGGYHQEVSDRADGVPRPVKRKPKDQLTQAGYIFRHQTGEQNQHALAYGPEGAFVGKIRADNSGDVQEVHIEPDHEHLRSQLEERMRGMLKKQAAMDDAPDPEWSPGREGFETLVGGREPGSSTMHLRDEKGTGKGAIQYKVRKRPKVVEVHYISSWSRGEGVGHKLMDELVRRYPEHSFDPINLSDTGGADFWDRYVHNRPGFRSLGSTPDWQFEHYPLEGRSHRVFGTEPSGEPRQHRLDYRVHSDGPTIEPSKTDLEHLPATARVPMVNAAVEHHGATGLYEPPAPKPEKLQHQVYYHGTTVAGVSHILPASQHGGAVMFPSDTEHDHAYASTDLGDAWDHAEKAFHSSDSGHPRVYQVRPIGGHQHVEEDPQEDAQGKSRGNHSSDVRSRHGWEVVHEMPMPKSMGTLEEWV